MFKKIGIILADDMEFKAFYNYAKNYDVEEIERKGQKFLKIDDGKHEIYAVESGVGKVNAAISAIELILNFDVEAILNAGYSGAVSGLSKGDVVAGTRYVECDFDFTALDYNLGEKPDGKLFTYPNKELLDVALTLEGMKSGNLGCGDVFLADTERKNFFKKTFEINAFDMESGALGVACEKYGVPFLSIRKISDNADDTAKEEYREENNLCKEDLAKILLEIVAKLQ
ncbi:MAG: 5'-methylthioadenosine/S-adenosylhomocysteine nucleosidase [Ruminococcaceae bacterium]|nr:5'-methylthioadenosine/S-adenosylhomocysteine nucleosidase [Oscillospiraceae bacterium]